VKLAHSPPSSAEFKNAWSYDSTPPVRFHGVCMVQIQYAQRLFAHSVFSALSFALTNVVKLLDNSRSDCTTIYIDWAHYVIRVSSIPRRITIRLGWITQVILLSHEPGDL
jgi:Flp pilus assembly protein protease CpaA